MSEFGAGLAQGTGQTFGPSLAQAMHNARLAKQRQEEMEYRRATENTRMAERALDRRERKDIRAEERERADRKTATEEARYQSGLLREDRDFKAAQANAALADVRRLEDRQIAEDRATDAEQRLLREEAERTRRYEAAQETERLAKEKKAADLQTALTREATVRWDDKFEKMQSGLTALSLGRREDSQRLNELLFQGLMNTKATKGAAAAKLRMRLGEAKMVMPGLDVNSVMSSLGEGAEAEMELLEIAADMNDPAAAEQASEIQQLIEQVGTLITKGTLEMDPALRRSIYADALTAKTKLEQVLGSRKTAIERFGARLLRKKGGGGATDTSTPAGMLKRANETADAPKLPKSDDWAVASIEQGVPAEYIQKAQALGKDDPIGYMHGTDVGIAGYYIQDPATNVIVPLPTVDEVGGSETQQSLHRLYRNEALTAGAGQEWLETMREKGFLPQDKTVPLTREMLSRSVNEWIEDRDAKARGRNVTGFTVK